MKHGTHHAYNLGCRCDECCDFKSRYRHDWRKARGLVSRKGDGWRGKSVRVDVIGLRHAIERDGRTVAEFARDIGVPHTTIDHVLVRGGTSERTLDIIACALGMHMSQLEERISA